MARTYQVNCCDDYQTVDIVADSARRAGLHYYENYLNHHPVLLLQEEDQWIDENDLENAWFYWVNPDNDSCITHHVYVRAYTSLNGL